MEDGKVVPGMWRTREEDQDRGDTQKCSGKLHGQWQPGKVEGVIRRVAVEVYGGGSRG